MEGEQRLRVLVVDDSPLQRRMHLVLLRAAAAPCRAVSNGAQAVEAVRREAFGLVLMDVEMPVLDGVEATRRIRRLDVPQPYIVGVTAGHPGFEAACRAAGMDDFTFKPLTPESVARYLEDARRFAFDEARPGG